MENRFKFRAFHKKEKYMEYCGLEFCLENLKRDDNDKDYKPPIGFSKFDFETWEITQCTGLFDKNGKLIFEGDVLRDSKFPEDDNTPFVVQTLIDGSYKYKYRNTGGAYPLDQRIINDLDSVIIGNIHQNQDLIK